MGILLIPVALALDAFGVSLSLGFSNKYRLRELFIFCLSFGFFQFLFSLTGGVFGGLVNSYILSIPKVFGGIVILGVGALMFKEALKKDDEDFDKGGKNLKSLYITLGISVSIDALVVGFTAYNLQRFNIIILNTLLIGLVTLILSLFGVFLSMRLRKVHFIEKYADFLGGLMLIAFGVKMIFF